MTVEVDTLNTQPYANPGVSISLSKQYPSSITTFDSSAFDNASSSALLSKTSNLKAEKVIAISPYSEPGHLLDLSTVEPPSQHLARALTHFNALRPDYATAPYVDTFNFSEVVQTVRRLAEQEQQQNAEESKTTKEESWSFYIVAFRSRVPVGTDRTEIYQLDAIAHREAMERGGLLKYWYGVPDINGRNLATCIWRSRADAKRGGSGPGHQRAMSITMKNYTEWKLERYRLRINPGDWTWSVTLWRDDEEE